MPVSIQPLDCFHEDRRDAFLAAEGWKLAKPLGADGSFRRYFCIHKGEQTAVLMESVPDSSPLSKPGHKISDFIRIGAWLREGGLGAPEIFAADEAGGYLVLEDFGGLSLKRAAADGEDAQVLYGAAVDVLKALRERPCPLVLPDYYASHVHQGYRQIMDYYVSALRGKAVPEDTARAYLDVWQEIESALPACPSGFMHVDYHAENLMWRPGKDGLKRLGILDFQGAMMGPCAYDVGNLLEDMRTDVPDGLRRVMLERYCGNMPLAEREAFTGRYRVLATQFHCRLMGQIVRWAVREGKTQYLAYQPRLAGYLERALEEPILAPLKHFFAEAGIHFRPPGGLERLLRAWPGPSRE